MIKNENQYNLYEAIHIFDPNVPIESIKKNIGQLSKIISKNSGKSVLIQLIHRKTLSWISRKQNYGSFVYHRYACSPSTIKYYDEYLKNLDICMLRQIILLDKNIDTKAYEDFDNEKTIISTDPLKFMKEISTYPQCDNNI